MNTKNIYYRLIILLLLIQVPAAAQNPPILPSPDFAVAHNATISGTVTTDEGSRPLPGIVAKLVRIGSPNVPISFALTDANGNYTLTGNSGVEYQVEFEYPSSGFSSTVGNPSATFTAVTGEQPGSYDLELTREANTYTNCNMSPSKLTSWDEPLSVEKPIPLNAGAVLQGVSVYTTSTVQHPQIQFSVGSVTTVTRLEIGAGIFTEGPDEFVDETTTYKLFASPPAPRNLTVNPGEPLTYYNISSGQIKETPLSPIPAAYEGTGAVDFHIWADAHALQSTTGGNVSTTVQTNAAAGVCVTYTYNSDPLPVKLISFTADADSENNVAVQWSTSEEANASHFEIEYSADSKQWTSIAKVNAANQNQSSYRFTHYNAPAGINFYRLKNVDFDGTSELSKIVSVRISSLSAQGRIYPNPASASDKLTLDFAESNITDVTVFDLSGRQLSRQQPSDNFIQLKGLKNGFYLLKLADTQGRVIHKTLLIR